MLDTKLESLPKKELLQRLEDTYIQAKPVNDKMVDFSMEIQTLNAEVLRRAISGWLPEQAVRRVRCVVAISCSRNLNEALPKLKERLDRFAEKNVPITAVEFDCNLNEFRFYIDPQTNPEKTLQ